ncbi:phage tail protein [Lentzea sp. NPDC055074]
MVSARREAEVTEALADGRRQAVRVSGSPHALLALQRDAGNAAVGALMAAKQKQPDESAIDAALKEVRRDEPEIDTVEKGLKAAQTAGVPVTLEGPKPPASALAVTTTGFGPNAVAPKKPTPPAKPVPAQSKLGKAGARPASPAGSAGARPGAAPAVPAVAAADPAFLQVTEKVKGFAAAKKAHPPASAKAKEAQDAAQAPSDDLAGQAKASKVDTMDAQQAGSFDKQAFIAAVKTAIEAKSPKTLQEATSPQGKADGVGAEVKGMVSQGKDGQTKDVEAATEAPPDQSKAVPKPVTPMAPENPGTAPPIPAAGAVPKPATPARTDLSAGRQQVAQEQGDVTDEQLQHSNEPQFQQALDAKQTAAAHADTAPGQFREQEQQVLGQAKADAGAVTAAGVAGMQGAKGAALAGLVADKGKTKTKDEAKRAEVTTRVQSIFAATETAVKKILDGIDPKVEEAFTKGEAQARQAFESFVTAKVGAYKQDRYSGWLGGFRWAKDKLLGMPDKVNEFYTAGRELYLKQMDGVISHVADVVGGDLSLAKQRIASGKAEIAAFVKTLSPDLRKVGAEASAEIGDRFSQLESDVTDKQNAVVDTLASKYVEARQGLDERVEALQAENKGFVDAAIDAVKGVITTIRELAAMLRDVLSRAAGVVGDIVKKPVEFLGNLIAGVKGGILKFKDNILDHLRKGLMGWLFGALAEAGIELPEKFDVRGIVRLLASIFGLTWSNIRSRLVRQIGEKAMSAAEKGVEIFQVLTSQGVAGLWQMLMDKLGDIKETILAQVKDFVVTKIITAGITWLIGLLNPAAAFIKACKLIYDVVMFFVNNGSRIMKFVNTVIDSVADIVRGNVSGVVNKINDVLGQMVPLIIGFLASAIGLGGIGAKIRSIIETLQKPVNKALDWVIKKGLTLAGPLIRAAKGISGKVKAKVAAGKAWVKGKLTGGEKAPAAAIDISKPVDMDGAGHTIFAKSSGPKLVIEMASRREEMGKLLTRARAELAERNEQDLPRKGLSKALDGVERPLALAENLYYSQFQPGGKNTADLDRRINEYVVEAAGLLVDIGRRYKMKSLEHLVHGSEWVTAEQELKGPYRGLSFRPQVYGGWNKDNATRGKNRKDAFDRLRALIPAGSPALSDRKAYFCPHCNQVRINHKDHQMLTFDHNPSVVNHWMSHGGNNMSFDERNTWYNGGPGGSTLVAMCGPCNSGKGGDNPEPNNFKVGTKFRGRGEGKA